MSAIPDSLFGVGMPVNGMYAQNNVSIPTASADPVSNGPDANHGEPNFSQLGDGLRLPVSHAPPHLGASVPVHSLDLSQLSSPPGSTPVMAPQHTPVNLEPFFSPSNTSAVPSPFALSQQPLQQQPTPLLQPFPSPHLVLPAGFHVDPAAASPVPQLLNSQPQPPIRLPYQQNIPAGFPQAGPSYPVPFATPQDYHFGAGVPSLIGQRAFSDEWPIEWDDEGDQMDNRPDLYPGMEMSLVKHRRRTTPEQLRILEAEFDRNNKPDNSKREELAAMLGMTKRNVQVWFQNRRAKMKNLNLKKEQAQEDARKEAIRSSVMMEGPSMPQMPHHLSMPPPPHPTIAIPPVPMGFPPSQSFESPPVFPSPQQPLHFPASAGVLGAPMTSLLPPVQGVNMGRRVSLANGEAARIGQWAQKRALEQQQGIPPSYGRTFRTPVMSQANAARRGSIPYPSPSQSSGNPLSPRMSPSVRPMPSALHLTAMSNSARRSSVPHTRLLSSAPFTPPRNGAGARELSLSQIKDAESENDSAIDLGDSDLSTTFITPQNGTYNMPPPGVPLNGPSCLTGGDDFVGTGPNPAFTFGQPAPLSEQEAARFQQIYMSMSQRGRGASVGSANTFNTESAEDAGSDLAADLGQFLPEDFEAEVRRMSGPTEVTDNLQRLGINMNSTPAAQPIRPSPLGSGFTPDSMGDPGGHQTPSFNLTDASPLSMSVSSSSQGPSPQLAMTQSHATPMTMLSMPPSSGQAPLQHAHSFPETPNEYTYINGAGLMGLQSLGYGREPVMLANGGRSHSDPVVHGSDGSDDAEKAFFLPASGNVDSVFVTV